MNRPSDIDAAPAASSQQRQPFPQGDESIMFLEQEQLVSDRSIAVPPARLSGRTRVALWLLRVFALVVSFMVIYTFAAQLH
jgi:hypothetical protein